MFNANTKNAQNLTVFSKVSFRMFCLGLKLISESFQRWLVWLVLDFDPKDGYVPNLESLLNT